MFRRANDFTNPRVGQNALKDMTNEEVKRDLMMVSQVDDTVRRLQMGRFSSFNQAIIPKVEPEVIIKPLSMFLELKAEHIEKVQTNVLSSSYMTTYLTALQEYHPDQAKELALHLSKFVFLDAEIIWAAILMDEIELINQYIDEELLKELRICPKIKLWNKFIEILPELDGKLRSYMIQIN